MLGQSSCDPSKAIEVISLATLYLYPVSLRAWGMRVSVTSDSDADNNVIWVLANIDGTKANNTNWKKESDYLDLVGSRSDNFRTFSRHLTPVVNSLSATSFLVGSTEILNGETVQAIVTWVLKDVATNTGGSGKFCATWTKQAGVLNKVSDGTIINQSDTPVAITLQTADDGNGGIDVQISTGGGSPFNATMKAELTFYKV